MTILKKINTLSIVLIAATIIGVGLDFGFKWYDYARGFRDGFKEGYQDEKAMLEEKDAPKTAEMTRVLMNAEAEDIAAEAAMSATDAQDADKVYEEGVSKEVADTEDVAIMSEDEEKDMEKSGLGGLLGIVAVLTLAIALLVAFVKLVLNYIGVLGTVKRGQIFSEDLERKTNHIGIELIVIYIAEWGLALFLGIDVAQTPSFGVLCCGIGMMIVSQIFALGRKMKEDQEFMV